MQVQTSEQYRFNFQFIFGPFQSNNTFFTKKTLWKMSIQCLASGFKFTSSWLWVSSLNNESRALVLFFSFISSNSPLLITNTLAYLTYSNQLPYYKIEKILQYCPHSVAFYGLIRNFFEKVAKKQKNWQKTSIQFYCNYFATLIKVGNSGNEKYHF